MVSKSDGYGVVCHGYGFINYGVYVYVCVCVYMYVRVCVYYHTRGASCNILGFQAMRLWCYSGVTVLSPRCYSGVEKYYNSVAVVLQLWYLVREQQRDVWCLNLSILSRVQVQCFV
jgi:hypothetical protein